MNPLFHHPFAVKAQLHTSLVLGYAAPIDRVRRLLPPQLEPDSFDAVHGYLAAAFVDTRALRPAGLPAILGQRFLMIGFRVFVRLRTASGKRLRGLYILRSETDSRQMKVLGNLLTAYRYEHTEIRLEDSSSRLRVSSGAALEIEALIEPNPPLPPQSPFSSWQSARRFAGPMPFTFSALPDSTDMLLVEGVRERWNPQPVRITEARVPFLEQLLHEKLQLANAFVMRDIPYHWKKAQRIECSINRTDSGD